MSTPHWIRPLIHKIFRQRFFWSRLTRYRPFGRLVHRLLFEEDQVFYLPANRVIEINESADAGDVVGVPVPSAVLEHFIRAAGFHWLMDFCICRESAGCRDYPPELGCLFMGEAARHINPRFGRPISMQAALAHAEKCREAGLVHMIGRNKIDALWLGVSPSRKLLTVCNCCPCCCLWQVLPMLHPRISEKISRMPGVRVSVTNACTGCGLCTRSVCFVNAIGLENGQAVIDADACRGCGRCAGICPHNAIAVTVKDTAFIDKTIERIRNAVDVQ